MRFSTLLGFVIAILISCSTPLTFISDDPEIITEYHYGNKVFSSEADKYSVSIILNEEQGNILNLGVAISNKSDNPVNFLLDKTSLVAGYNIHWRHNQDNEDTLRFEIMDPDLYIKRQSFAYYLAYPTSGDSFESMMTNVYIRNHLGDISRSLMRDHTIRPGEILAGHIKAKSPIPSIRIKWLSVTLKLGDESHQFHLIPEVH